MKKYQIIKQSGVGQTKKIREEKIKIHLLTKHSF